MNEGLDVGHGRRVVLGDVLQHQAHDWVTLVCADVYVDAAHISNRPNGEYLAKMTQHRGVSVSIQHLPVRVSRNHTRREPWATCACVVAKNIYAPSIAAFNE